MKIIDNFSPPEERFANFLSLDLSNSIYSEMEFPAVALRASSSFPEQNIREMLSVHEKGRRVSPGQSNKNWAERNLENCSSR